VSHKSDDKLPSSQQFVALSQSSSDIGETDWSKLSENDSLKAVAY